MTNFPKAIGNVLCEQPHLQAIVTMAYDQTEDPDPNDSLDGYTLGVVLAAHLGIPFPEITEQVSSDALKLGYEYIEYLQGTPKGI